MKTCPVSHIIGKSLSLCLVCLLASLWAMPMLHGVAWAGEPTKARQLKLMSTFISNFTEVGLFDFDVDRGGNDTVQHLGSTLTKPELIRFGILHNYVNNAKSRIKPCPVKGCKYGPLVIDAQYVAESVKKYFDINLKHHSVDQPDASLRCHFDGKRYHFEWADDYPPYHAQVKQATQEGDVVVMTGVIPDPEDTNAPPRSFVATAKPYKWNGKDTWAILSMRTTESNRNADAPQSKSAK